MNRTACWCMALASAGLLGGVAAYDGGTAAKQPPAPPTPPAAARREQALQQPAPITEQERAFVGEWRIDLDAIVAMSDPGWVQNSVPEVENVRIGVHADHTAFVCTPKSEFWFRWTVRDGALIDADADNDHQEFRFTLKENVAYLKVALSTEFFDRQPLPLRRIAALKQIDPALLPGTWKFSYDATLATDGAMRKERERLNVVDKYGGHESVEARLKQMYPDGPPSFILHKNESKVDIAVLPHDNARRFTSGQMGEGANTSNFSYGVWGDVVVFFNQDGWSYIRPNMNFLRMVDGRLHWRIRDETFVFEREATSAP